MRGKVDAAFLRREAQAPGIAFKFLIKEPQVAVLPTGHRLAARKEVRLQDIAGETYITPTPAAPVLKAVIDAYAAKVGVTLKPQYESENPALAMSLVASTGGVTLQPLYAENLLSSAVVIRPLQGKPLTESFAFRLRRAWRAVRIVRGTCLWRAPPSRAASVLSIRGIIAGPRTSASHRYQGRRSIDKRRLSIVSETL
jgi:DNA-binding transcriptional LysR family regulator